MKRPRVRKPGKLVQLILGILFLLYVANYGIPFADTTTPTPAPRAVVTAEPACVTDCATPPAHYSTYTTDIPSGQQWCDDMLTVLPPGSTCEVLPYDAPLRHSPTGWTEYDNNLTRGAAKCAADLRQDPGVGCDVRPQRDYLP